MRGYADTYRTPGSGPKTTLHDWGIGRGWLTRAEWDARERARNRVPTDAEVTR